MNSFFCVEGFVYRTVELEYGECEDYSDMFSIQNTRGRQKHTQSQKHQRLWTETDMTETDVGGVEVSHI